MVFPAVVLVLFEDTELLSYISFKGALVLELLATLLKLAVAFRPVLLNLFT